MELTLVDGKKAEFWREPGLQNTYSPFRVRVFRNGLCIGNGATITAAEKDVNDRLIQMGYAK
jgi:hypothetical protein